jgi:cytosine/adenosine deaminase-related metal-dependent hydrolase
MRLLIEAANTTIAVDEGKIIPADGRFDRVVRAPAGEIRPGFINGHEHLHRNHYGRLGAPPYENAYVWAQDIQRRDAAEIARGRALPRRRALLKGAWKNLLAGVTCVVHHDAWEPDFEIDFPIRVARVANADSLAMLPATTPAPGEPFALHLSEGVDGAAAEEVRTLDTHGFLNANLLAVHCVGPDADGIARLRASGCAVVWCPTSNHFLFERSVPAALLAEGTDVLLGSDSLLTGTGTLLEELRAARHIISDARIFDAVGALAARRLGMTAPSLANGAPADVVLVGCAALEARVEDVLLVMVGGQLRVLHPDLVPVLNVVGGRMVTWRGTSRWISEMTFSQN